MQIVPLQPIPNQTVIVQLENQPCALEIVQYAYGLFMTVTVNGTLIIAGVLCENFNRIVRSTYLGFSGDFAFLDTQGTLDPDYMGLGGSTARFQLLYLTEADLG